MARFGEGSAPRVDLLSYRAKILSAFFLLSCSFPPLSATNFDSSHSEGPIKDTSPRFSSLKEDHPDLLVREIRAGDSRRVLLAYADQKIVGYVKDKTGQIAYVKSYDMPRELQQLRSPALFEAFCQNAYARSRFLSNGEVSFSLYQRGLGGGRLHDAAESGGLDNLNSLLADPNISSQINTQNESGWAPLHCAAMRGDVEASRLLLDYGANIHQVGTRGMTPLHLSVQQNRPEVCQLLLERGASVEALNENGQTVLDLALASNTGRIIQLLREHAKSARMRIFEAEADEIDPLLQHSTDVRRKRKSCLVSGAILGAACLVGGGVTVPVVILTRKKPPPQPSSSLSVSSSARPPSSSHSLPFSRSGSSSLSLSDSLTSPLSLSVSPSFSRSLSLSRSSSFAPSSFSPSCIAQLSLDTLNGRNGFMLLDLESGPGYSVSGAGDINGDWIDDMIIGAPFANKWTGISYLVFGRTETWPSIISLANLNGVNGFSLNGVTKNNLAGSVSRAGDVNNDGIDDIIIGAEGASYVVFGHAGNWPATISLNSLNGANGFNLTGTGSSGVVAPVSDAGDVNNDGIDDMIIGSPFANNMAGASYVVFGHAGAWPAEIPLSSLNGTNGFSLNGVTKNNLGGSVRRAGDVNNDGIDDIIIGAQGASYVVFGHAGNWPSTVSLSVLNGRNGFILIGLEGGQGLSVSSAGDINNDGIDDVIVGATSASNSEGVSYVIFGQGESWPMTISLNSLNGTNGFNLKGPTGSFSGSAVSGAGDVNNDGIDDMIIGAPSVNNDVGASYVVFGHNGTWPATAPLSSLNGTNGFNLTGVANIRLAGYSMSGAGDVNGDRIDDVIVGAPNNNIIGASYVVFGQHPCERASSFTLEETSKTSKTAQKEMSSQLQKPDTPSKRKPDFSRDVDASSATSLQPMWTNPFSPAFRAMRSFPSFFSSEGSVEQMPTAPLQRNFNDYIKAFNLLKDSDVRLRENYVLQAHVKLGLVRGKLQKLSENSQISARHLREVRANFAEAFLLLPALEPLSSTYNLAVPLNISLPQPSNYLGIWG